MADASVTAAATAAPTQDATYRKIALRLLPFLMACFVIAYLDRINIGIAKLNMLADLGFSEAIYGLGAGLFFIAYTAFAIPNNLVMHRIGPARWIGFAVLAWGLITGLMAFVSTPWQFYTLRLLLGVAEAGFYPGVILYLSYWFPNNRISSVTSYFQCGIPLAGMFGSPLSGWIMESFNHVGGRPGWQWIFLLQAFPSIPLAIAAWTFLPSGSDKARWLNEQERQMVKRDLSENKRTKEDVRAHVALWDARTLRLTIVTVAVLTGTYTIGFYMPTLIKNAGIASSTEIGMLSAIPYLIGMIVMILVSRSSDRKAERRIHLAGCFLVGGLGLLGTVFFAESAVLVVTCLAIATAGIMSASPIISPMPAAYLGGAALAVTLGFLNSMGNLGGFFSPYLIGWVSTTFHSMDPAIYVIVAILIVGALTALSYPAASKGTGSASPVQAAS